MCTPDDYDNLPDGASPNWTIADELAERRVVLIRQPGVGKTATAQSMGDDVDTAVVEICEMPMGWNS